MVCFVRAQLHGRVVLPCFNILLHYGTIEMIALRNNITVYFWKSVLSFDMRMPTSRCMACVPRCIVLVLGLTATTRAYAPTPVLLQQPQIANARSFFDGRHVVRVYPMTWIVHVCTAQAGPYSSVRRWFVCTEKVLHDPGRSRHEYTGSARFWFLNARSLHSPSRLRLVDAPHRRV